MKWLEIIELRTGSNQRQALEECLKHLGNELANDPSQPEFRIYESSGIQRDVSCHLLHFVDLEGQEQSVLGSHIVSLLRPFGLINHTLWKERGANKTRTLNLQENG
ncbi:MAG: hypothetical protein RIF33_07230 [Cyclobacteriaceae bacterium]